MKSKIIAISSIGAGFTAICLTLGAYIEAMDLISLVLASVFVVMPLYFNSYKGAFLCFGVGGVIAFMLSGFNIFSVVFPAYFLFFGLYPILKALSVEKRVNVIVCRIIGLVWSVLVVYGIYYYYVYVMNFNFNDLPSWASFITDNITIFIGIFGVIFYFVYDRYVVVTKRVVDYYLYKAIK